MAKGGSRPGSGRKPKPPALRLEAGTKFRSGPRADPVPGKVELLAPGEGLPDHVPAGPMVAPADLSDRELFHFGQTVRTLEEQKRCSPHFEPFVTLLARRLADIERLSAVIELEGDTVESKSAKKAGKDLIITTMKRAHPAVAMRAEAMRHAQSLLGELMLSPLSALKLGGAPQAAADPFDF